MAESSTFDVAIHLGPGVTSIQGHNKADESDEDSDPNKSEVQCTCKLMFGISFSIFVVASLAVILVLYLLCMLSYQVETACYYKEHRMPNFTSTPVS